MSATWCGAWPSRNRAEAETKHRAHPILHVFDALTPCLGVQRTPAHLLDLRLIDLLRLDPCERDPCEMTCDFRRFKRKEWPVLFRPSPAGFDSTANASRRRTNHQLLLVRTARFTTNSGSSVPPSPASLTLEYPSVGACSSTVRTPVCSFRRRAPWLVLVFRPCRTR